MPTPMRNNGVNETLIYEKKYLTVPLVWQIDIGVMIEIK
jgi:hypothetical protein